MKVERKTINAAPAPAAWHSVSVGNLVIYREAQDDSYQKQVTVNRTREDGAVYYRDPDNSATNVGWFADGDDIPAGWEPEKVQAYETVARTKRGDIHNVQIVEQDANGNVISPGTEGYPAFRPFNTDELRDLAVANAATVGAKYEAAIVALQELADAIYTAANG